MARFCHVKTMSLPYCGQALDVQLRILVFIVVCCLHLANVIDSNKLSSTRPNFLWFPHRLRSIGPQVNESTAPRLLTQIAFLLALASIVVAGGGVPRLGSILLGSFSAHMLLKLSCPTQADQQFLTSRRFLAHIGRSCIQSLHKPVSKFVAAAMSAE